MVGHGDAWRAQTSEVFTLLHKPTNQAGTASERVGHLSLKFDRSWISQAEHGDAFVNNTFGDIGWDRRILNSYSPLQSTVMHPPPLDQSKGTNKVCLE